MGRIRLSGGSRRSARRRRIGAGAAAAEPPHPEQRPENLRTRCERRAVDVLRRRRGQRALGQREQRVLARDVLRLDRVPQFLEVRDVGPLSPGAPTRPSWCPSAGSPGWPDAGCLRRRTAFRRTPPGWPRRMPGRDVDRIQRCQRIGCRRGRCGQRRCAGSAGAGSRRRGSSGSGAVCSAQTWGRPRGASVGDIPVRRRPASSAQASSTGGARGAGGCSEASTTGGGVGRWRRARRRRRRRVERWRRSEASTTGGEPGAPAARRARAACGRWRLRRGVGAGGASGSGTSSATTQRGRGGRSAAAGGGGGASGSGAASASTRRFRGRGRRERVERRRRRRQFAVQARGVEGCGLVDHVARGGAGQPAAADRPRAAALGAQHALGDRDLLFLGGQVRGRRVLAAAVRPPGARRELQPALVSVAGVDGPVAAGFAACDLVPFAIGGGAGMPGEGEASATDDCAGEGDFRD